ncbi:MAG: tryptophan-rich sensory protein [Clostridia bacterium]|nr:tryptophan-rich sensory protein [Clostridia bacterium]
MDKSKLKVYGLFILITEAVGTVAGLLTTLGMEKYSAVEKPALTPPEIVFPIVWTILYALMAVGAARVWLTEESEEKDKGLKLYVVQLGMNFLWSILFFNFQAYGFSFFWLLGLLLVIVLMTLTFYKSDRIAAYLQIPYILWVSFAGYLNFMVWLLNR